MKTTKWARENLFTLVVGAAIAIGLGLAIQAQVRQNSTIKGSGREVKASDYEISGPYAHKNLAIFLVHGSDKISGRSFLTLQEALAQKKVIVFETKSVNELAIQNLSNEDVYVQSGEIVKGGQQDRMLAVDLIVPARSGKIPIAAFCVESGRWTKRGSEQATNFSSSSAVANTKDLKLAAKVAASQGDVWKNVTVAQDKLSANVGTRVNSTRSESSLQLAVENVKVQEIANSYTRELERIVKSRQNVIGYVFAINGKVNSADVYASNALFLKLWPKLLQASAIEAIAELQQDLKVEPLSAGHVKAFLAESESAAPSEKAVTRRVKLVTRENKESVFFETRDGADDNAWVHRNYIRKN
jgi:hypothetical protein